MSKEFQQWHWYYYANERPAQNMVRISTPGTQYIVHLLRGGYLGEDWNDGNGRRAMDVGCGLGYNAVTFALPGCKVSFYMHGRENK